MPVSYKLEHVIERARADGEAEKRKLKRAAGARRSPSEAQVLWPQVLEHKWYMSERLGRDVGLRAAVADYFQNVLRITKRDLLRDTLPLTLPSMRPFGYR